MISVTSETAADWDEMARLATEAFAPAMPFDPARLRWIYQSCFAEGAIVVSLHVDGRKVGQLAILRHTLRIAGRDLADWVGRMPREFCYPYGWRVAVGAREVGAVRDAGYAVAVTTRPGVLTGSGTEDPLTLARISLNGLYQRPRYVRALISGLPFHVA